MQSTGLGISTLQKHKSDERKPKPEQLLKISQALGISINVFMDFDIHTVSDLLSLIFKMNEQLDLNFNAEKDPNGNVIPDTLSLSFGNPLINQKLAAYITFLDQLSDTEKLNMHSLLCILRTNYLMTIKKFTRLLPLIRLPLIYQVPLFLIHPIKNCKIYYLTVHHRNWHGY